MPDLLVDASWLAAHIDDPKIRIVDMDLPLGYEKAHIPNAVGIPNQSIKAKDSKLVMMPGEFKEMMQSKGIGDDTLVVAYDSNKSLNACRLWWVMNYYGHTNIKVLNGGWRKWLLEGNPASFKPSKVEDNLSFTPRANAEILSTAESLKTIYDAEGVVVWDTRSFAEYNGENDRGNARKGHIPGAHHLEWQSLIKDDDHTFKPPDEMQALLNSAGITSEKIIHTY